MADPAEGAERRARWPRAAGLTAVAAPYAASRTGRRGHAAGALADCPAPDLVGPGDGSAANDASVVLLVEVAGVRLLLTGDVEPEAQAALARPGRGCASTY